MAEESQLKIGDLVWAKMKGFSPWPARVVKPGPNSRKQTKKGCHWIYFFGSNNYAWIEEHNIKPYEQYKGEFTSVCKSVPFKEAVEDIEEYIAKKRADANYEAEFDNFLQNETEAIKNQSPAKKPKKSTPAKRQSDSTSKGPEAKKPRQSASHDKVDENGAAEEQYEDEISVLPPALTKPDSPTVDLDTLEPSKIQDVAPSSIAVGFMGLGNMGSHLVKNLINSGHRVNLWNRSFQKCEDFKSQAEKKDIHLVQTYLTPYDVVQNSDIIFNCLSDPRAAKEVVIGNCGVIHQADSEIALAGKGYIEMTSVDPETSKDIADIIVRKGGRYLEAQMQGSKKQADEGSLIILAGGDHSLFKQAQSCFKAMAKTSFYLGEVGTGTKMNLCINMTLGISLAGLAESMALAERSGLSLKDFLEIFSLSEGASSYLKNKGNKIVEKSYHKVEQALMYMQKDIRLCLEMSEHLKQNLHVGTAANEVYKMARRAGHEQHDVSMVYTKLRN